MNRNRIIGLVSLIIVLIGGVALYRHYGAATGTARTPQTAASAVPVTTALAQAEDFAIRRRTIGAMESPATVVVKSRIESQVVQQHVRDGQLVKKGELLFTLDDRAIKATLARNTAQLAKDQAAVVRTAADLERYQTLIERNAAPRQQLDQATADNKAAIATVEADQAQLQADNLQLGFTKIEAPIGGRLGAIRVTPGNLVSVNDATGLVTITQIRPIRVNFTLPEADLAALRKASISLTPAAVRVYRPAMSEPLATGTLDFVDSAVDSTSGTVSAKAIFDNTTMELWPGMYVDVEIDLDIRPKTVMIPAVAIQSGQKGPFVFVAKADQKVEMRKIELVGIEGDRAALASGVNDGERIVVEGQMRLADGARVTEVPAADAGRTTGSPADTPNTAGTEAPR